MRRSQTPAAGKYADLALRPVGVENYVHVVMPMFVQW